MKHFGKLKPRYLFFYNKNHWFRASKCLKCDKLTAQRKFAFFIHIEKIGATCFGLTSRYCSKCEFIILHQKDFEAELFQKFGESIKDFLVIGTVDKKVWKQGIEGQSPTFKEIINNLADFKKVVNYDIKPAGWYFDED